MLSLTFCSNGLSSGPTGLEMSSVQILFATMTHTEACARCLPTQILDMAPSAITPRHTEEKKVPAPELKWTDEERLAVAPFLGGEPIGIELFGVHVHGSRLMANVSL